jgi:hypothetical protein
MEDVGGPRRPNMAQGSMPNSEAFWGRKHVPTPQEHAVAHGPQPYPCLMYHPDGRMQAAASEEEKKEAIENGWEEKPSLIHRETLQGAGIKRLPTAGSEEAMPEEEQVPKTWKTKKTN